VQLNIIEFCLMNNNVRRFIQEYYEFEILKKMIVSKQLHSVLEIGCGSGNGARLINKHFKPEKMIGIDFDERMIKRAKQRISDPNIVFQRMDAAKLQFGDNSFDAVFDFGIIHHIPDWKTCISEIKRVLKNGGELIIEDLSLNSFENFPGVVWKSLLAHPYEQMFTMDEFLEYLKEAGFIINSFKKFNPLKMINFFSLSASSLEKK